MVPNSPQGAHFKNNLYVSNGTESQSPTVTGLRGPDFSPKILLPELGTVTLSPGPLVPGPSF